MQSVQLSGKKGQPISSGPTELKVLVVSSNQVDKEGKVLVAGHDSGKKNDQMSIPVLHASEDAIKVAALESLGDFTSDNDDEADETPAY
jgi:hypothetical protein